MNRPRTTFATGINPFEKPQAKPTAPPPAPTTMTKPATKPATKRAKNKSVYTDPATLQITDDALPTRRALPQHKYNPVFERMRYGQCIRCASAEVGKVAGAMRKYVETKGKTAHVKTVIQFPGDDGFGRVWLLEAAKKSV